MSTQPNILFICVDQWRGDCLGSRNHPTVQTPHLDNLAHEGILFQRAYSACPSCIPARAALLTGMEPKNNGFVGYRDGVDWNYKTTLPSLMSDAGYQTHCVGKMHVHPARNRLGFDSIDLHDGYLHFSRGKFQDPIYYDDYIPWLRQRSGRIEADYVDTGIGCNGYAVKPWVYEEALHPTNWVTTKSIEFLQRRDPTAPFFLKVSYHRPHPPLDPPIAYYDMYKDKELPPVNIGDWVDHGIGRRALDSPVPTKPDEIDQARKAYYAHLTHIDHQINRIFMSLHEENVLHNTLIIFTSDHGDMLYDHNHIAKQLPLEASANIPFIVRFPKTPEFKDFKTGVDMEHPVELIDILPTCCDAAGIDIPEQADGQSIFAISQNTKQAWRKELHGEHHLGDNSNHWFTDGREKYIWFSNTGKELLFDLVDDPLEKTDLTNSRPERVAYWQEKLLKELEGRPEGYVENGKLVIGKHTRATLDHAGIGV